MMCAGWPDHPGYLLLRNGVPPMPEKSRPARAIAITAAQESRRRLVAIGINCALAALLVAVLAVTAL